MKKFLMVVGLIAVWNSGVYAVPGVNDCIATFARYVPNCAEWSFQESGGQYFCYCDVCAQGYYKVGSSGHNTGQWILANECAKQDSGDSGTGTGGGTTPTATCPSGYAKCTTGQCHGPSVTIDGVIWCGNLDSGVKVCSTKPSYVTSAYFMSDCCKTGAYTAADNPTSCVFMGCATGMTLQNGKCVCAQGYYGTASTGCEDCPSLDGIKGTTSGVGTDDITGCYIPGNTIYSDTSGEYKYIQDCYYKM